VKLHQFDPMDRTVVRLDTTITKDPVLPLFHDAHEEVRIEHWDAEAQVTVAAAGGLELFVIDGSFEESGETFAKWDWLRLPPGADFRGLIGADGAKVWVKSGHLRSVPEK
jgi:hypothetical protein